MGMEAGSVLRSPAASLPVGSALERPERRPRPLTWRVRDRVSPRGRGAFSLCPAWGAVVAGVPSGPGGPVPGPVPAASGSSAGKALTRVVATRLVTGTPACRTGSGETRPPAPPFPPCSPSGRGASRCLARSPALARLLLSYLPTPPVPSFPVTSPRGSAAVCLLRLSLSCLVISALLCAPSSLSPCVPSTRPSDRGVLRGPGRSGPVLCGPASGPGRCVLRCRSD